MRLGRTAGLVLMMAALAPAAAGPPSVDAAAVALHDGNASNAVALATQALDDAGLTPRDRSRVLVDRGLAHEMLGEHDGALIDLTEAINARALPAPEQSQALYDRGVTLDELDRTDDAAGDYSAAIRLQPKFAAALNNRGNAYRRLGKLAEARIDYLASIAAGNPHAEYPDFGLGQIAEAGGRPNAARAYYRAALAANPQFALASERLTALANPASMAVAPAQAPPPAADSIIRLRRPTAAGANATAADDGAVHLHMPARPGILPDPSDDGIVHLRPAGENPIHLHPPRRRRAAVADAAPDLDLKPAFSEGAAVGETVQLGAWRNQGDAANAWSYIAAKSGRLLAGLSPQVVSVDLPGKGRYYRLRASLPPPVRGAALCAALSAMGHGCMVVRG